MKFRMLLLVLFIAVTCTSAFAGTTAYVYDEQDRLQEITLENGLKMVNSIRKCTT